MLLCEEVALFKCRNGFSWGTYKLASFRLDVGIENSTQKSFHDEIHMRLHFKIFLMKFSSRKFWGVVRRTSALPGTWSPPSSRRRRLAMVSSKADFTCEQLVRDWEKTHDEGVGILRQPSKTAWVLSGNLRWSGTVYNFFFIFHNGELVSWFHTFHIFSYRKFELCRKIKIVSFGIKFPMLFFCIIR